MQILQFIKDWPLLRRLFSKVPGPLLAKLTRLWKTYHLLRGTYEDRLKTLHALQGPLVQVAPQEFSWEFNADSDRQHLRNFEKFNSSGSSTIHPQALTELATTLKMERLNLNEHLLNACDDQFLAILADAAQKHTPIDMAELLTRYAFDVMLTMTTGQRAGFLDHIPERKKILTALCGWKFHSILYGSYLRYHPFIKAILNALRFRSQGGDVFDPVMQVVGQPTAPPSSDGAEVKRESHTFPIAAIEARVALAIAGADPAISLMLKVFETLSQDLPLQRLLVGEITDAALATPTTFQTLVTRKLDMPRMHALIQQVSRAQHLSDIGLSFVTGRGARLGGFLVPEGHTVHVRANNGNTDISGINSLGAFDPGLAPELNRQLPAYNLWNQDHSLDDCHSVLVTKLVTHVLNRFSVTSNGGGKHVVVAHVPEGDEPNQPPTLDGEKVTDVSRMTNITPSDMDILGENLGPVVTEELFRRFDPAPGSIYGRDSLIVGPIAHPAARAGLHHALERIYGKRLQHKTDMDNIMHFAASSTYLRLNTHNPRHRGRGGARSAPPRKIRYAFVHPWYKDVVGRRQGSNPTSPTSAATRSPRSTAAHTSSATAPPPQGREENPVWAGWSTNEHQKAVDAKSAASYAKQLQQQQQNASNTDTKPVTRFKETFKQTAPNSNGTGPRLVLRTDQTIRDADGNMTVTSSDGVMLEPPAAATTEGPTPAVRPPGFLPPHKRAELERERKRLAEQTTATAVASSQTPQTTSPLYQAAGTAMFVPSASPSGQHGAPRSAPSPATSIATSPSQASTSTRSQSVASSASLWGILSDTSSD
ncbi:Putative cytochrome P450 superfamily [Septoria linicola]|uniref:Cytochrome P450 superfamily n=1 Tax=Septoria linicola TaxID=215465 RepID=A0A9Q9AM84_9PEZI|nr:Putative cytochrome P450 superfamily [Septoria linicola]